MPTGTSLLGQHPLDVLGITTDPEVATFGSCNTNAYIRLYDCNETLRGYTFGLCNSTLNVIKEADFASNTIFTCGSSTSSNTRVAAMGSNASFDIRTNTATHRIGTMDNILGVGGIAASNLCISGGFGSNVYSAVTDHVFIQNTNAVPLVRFTRVNNEARLAVGLSNPSTALDINGSINFTGNLNSNGSPYLLGFSDITSTYSTLRNRVGINTTPSSSYALDVNGNLNFTGSLNSNGAPFLSGFTEVTNTYSRVSTTLGIGTVPNTSYALDVNGAINFTGNLTQNGETFLSGFSSVTSTNAVISKSLGINQTPGVNNVLDVASSSGTVMSVSTSGTLSTPSVSIGVPQVVDTQYYAKNAIIVDGNASAPVATITGMNIAEDSNGNIYICGEYSGTSAITLKNLDGTASSYTLAALAAGSVGSYLVKYNSSGAVTGATRFVASGQYLVCQFTNVCVDGNNTVYVAGKYVSNGTAADIFNLDGTTSSYKLPSAAAGAFMMNLAVIRYSSTGVVISHTYIKTVNTYGYHICSLATDPTNNDFYILAETDNTNTNTIYNFYTTTLGAGTVRTFDGLFLAKYTSAGTFVGYANVYQLPALPRDPVTRGLAIDSSGNVYISTTSRTNFTYNVKNLALTPTNSSYSLPFLGLTYGFIVRYNSSGNVTASSYFGLPSTAFSVTIDSSNNLYVCGTYGGYAGSIMNLNGTTTQSFNGDGLNDVPYVLKFNSSGVCTNIVKGTVAGGFVPRILTCTTSGDVIMQGSTSTTSTISFTPTRAGISLRSPTANVSNALVQISSDCIVVSAVSFGVNGTTYDTGCVMASRTGGVYLSGRIRIDASNTATVYNISTLRPVSLLTLPSTAGIISTYIVKYEKVTFASQSSSTKLQLYGDILTNMGSIGMNVLPSANSIVDVASFAGTRLTQIDNVGNITTIGDITAFGSLSDKRMKTDIADMDPMECVNRVNLLRPVRFVWNSNAVNSEYVGRKDIGLLAQELEEVLPEAVLDKDIFNNALGSVKTVRYERIIPLLIGAIKNLHDTNSNLQSRMELLESKV